MVSTVEWRKKISKLKTIDLIPSEKKRGNIKLKNKCGKSKKSYSPSYQILSYKTYYKI